MKTVLISQLGWLVIPAAVHLGPWSLIGLVALFLLILAPIAAIRFVRAIGHINPQIGRVVSELKPSRE